MAFLILLTLNSCSEDVNYSCTSKYPDNYFSVLECQLNKTVENYEYEHSRKREEQARTCISNDLPRMEKLAIDVRSYVIKLHDEKTSEKEQDKAVDELNKILKNQSKIASKDNIKEKVVVGSIPTECNSDFHILVNIHYTEAGDIKFLSQFAENAPTGYPFGFHSEFSVNFEKHRPYQEIMDEDLRNQIIGDSEISR